MKAKTTPMRLTDDERAVMEQNLNLVYKLARRYHEEKWAQKAFASWRDMIGPGCEGLAQAIKAFDPTRGKLSTIAWVCIRRAMRRAALQEGLVRRTEWEWRNTNKKPMKPRPKVNAGRIAEDWAVTSPDSELESAEEREHIAWAVNHAREYLSGREAVVITQIFYQGRSERQVAADLGISQVMVHYVKRRAIGRLREIVSDLPAWQRDHRLPGTKRPKPMIAIEPEVLQAA